MLRSKAWLAATHAAWADPTDPREHSRMHRHHRFRSARTSGRDAPKQPRTHGPIERPRHTGHPGAVQLFERGVSSTLAPPTGQPGDGWRARFRWNSLPPQPYWSYWWTLRPAVRCCWPAPLKQLLSSLRTDHGFRSAVQQLRMGEVGGLRFTAVTRLFSQRLQEFELFHGQRSSLLANQS